MYPHTYEKMFVTDKELSRIKPGSIDVTPFESINEYEQAMSDLFFGFQEQIWLTAVKFLWLRRSYYYNFKTPAGGLLGESAQQGSFNTFMRLVGGFEPLHAPKIYYFRLVEAYLDDIYPSFSDYNPFEYEYEFPFEKITIDHLHIVQSMTERMELLDYADEQGMSYANFGDFCINYAMHVNEEAGKTVYAVKKSNTQGIKIESYE